MHKREYSGLLWLWLTAFVIVIDKLTKMLAVENLTPYKPLVILPFFNLTLAFNKGAAFGFLHQASGNWQNIVFSIIAVIVCLMILFWLKRSKFRDYLFNISLALIMGGALGNVWDRLVYGFVVDFFSFHLGEWHFAIFNVADSVICIGAALLILHWLINTTD